MTLGCKACGINYPPSPQYKHCKVCGAQTINNFAQSPDPDYKEKIELGFSGVEIAGSSTVGWRFGQLIRAGFAPSNAVELAGLRTPDVRTIVGVASKAGPDLAYSIFR